jgi:hypothetical protein
MAPEGFKPANPASEWLQTTAFICAATRISKENFKINTTQVKIDCIKYGSPM